MPPLKRTNIVLDMKLVDRAKELYGFRSAREAVDCALRQLVAAGVDPYEIAKDLEGSMILPPLDELRPGAPIEEL
jgi:Arc/MetJ family transcription regulator